MRYSEWFSHWWAEQQINWNRTRSVRYDDPAMSVWLSSIPSRTDGFSQTQIFVDELYALTGRPMNFRPVVRINNALTGGIVARTLKTYPPRIETRSLISVRNICHEIAHAIDMYDGGEIVVNHGPEWQAWYDKLIDLVIEHTEELFAKDEV